jgi:hypothetical protein
MPATQQSHLILPISHGPLRLQVAISKKSFVPFKDYFLYNRVMCFGEEITKSLADGDFNSKNGNS